MYLHRLVVKREFQGRNLGKLCLDLAKERARERNCTAMRLDCSVDVSKLCEFYEKCGFQKHSILKRNGTYDVQRFFIKL